MPTTDKGCAAGMFSENVSEKKRGRPRVLSKEIETRMRGIGAFRQTTRRGRLNEYYFYLGHPLFRGDDGKLDGQRIKRWGWLHYNTMGSSGSGVRFRQTIIAEIGRLDDLETRERAADLICELKPRARQAAAMIRRWRRPGQSKPASDLDLTQALCRAYNEYRSTHVDLTLKDARLAVSTLDLIICDASNNAGEARP